MVVMDESTGRSSVFGGMKGAAARHAWSASTARMRTRYGRGTVAERAALLLGAAVALGLLLLILIPAVLLGTLALVVGWGYLTGRRVMQRLRGPRSDRSLRRNVRVIRR